MSAFCPPYDRKRSGFILITVLLISTLFLSIAAAFALFARQEMRRVAEEEFALISRSLASVACRTAAQWIGADSNEYDSELELLYSPEFPVPLQFGDWDVLISIRPLDRLLPINDLFLPDGVTVKKEFEYPWSRIMERVEIGELSSLLLDFLDRDKRARPGSREDLHFPNRALGDLSEFLRLSEVTPEILYTAPTEEGEASEALDRFLTLYGEKTININVAPREILAILDAELKDGEVDSILTYRMENPLQNAKDLVKIPGFPSAVGTRLTHIIGYQSNYFEVNLEVAHSNRTRSFSIILKRAGSDCQMIAWKE